MPFAQKLKISAFLGMAGFALPGLGFADTTWTWDFGSSSCVANCGTNYSGRSLTKTFEPLGSATTPQVVASGWANTEPGATNNQLEAANIAIYGGGLGASHSDGEDSGSPQHAVDNDGRYELVMFDFGGTSITLTEVQLGWYSNDADISVLAYQGSGVPTLDGVNYSGSSEGLTGSGWTLIGNYDVDNLDSSDPYDINVNSGMVESSYWIIAAYNDVFGTDCDPSGKCQTSYKDYFKIEQLTGKHKTPPPPPPGVPVPGTVLLTGLGIAMLARMRLKRAAR